MRCFGEWRRGAIALGLAVTLGTGLSESADAGIFFHTVPRVAPAYDYSTGGEFFAPPVPYGHYAKDPAGAAAKAAAHASATAHGLMNDMSAKAHGMMGNLAGLGRGLGHGNGMGCGHGVGHGLGGAGCGLGCGLGAGGLGGGLGHGLGGLGHGLGCGLGGCGLGAGGCGIGGHGHGSGLCGDDPCGTTPVAAGGRVKNFGPIHPATVVATGQTAPSAQAVVLPTSQHVGGTVIGDPCSSCHGGGCGLCGGRGLLGRLNGGGLGHGIGDGPAGKLKCHLCGGQGCGGCGGSGFGDPCSSCRGGGCGLCNGSGLLSRLKQCSFCGGAGCKMCLSGLKGRLHGLLGGIVGPKYDYFVGAGGPVPLTPGYVPYIVTTRSPRDFFAFPPRTPDGF